MVHHESTDSLFSRAAARGSASLLEHEVYGIFEEYGLSLPPYIYANDDNISTLPSQMGDKKWVAKVVIKDCLHKTDIGGVSFNITSSTVVTTYTMMKEKFAGTHDFQGVLFVEMVSFSSGFASEMLISGYHDPFFGPCIAFGFGGTIVEFTKDIMKPNKAQIIIPASLELSEFESLIRQLPIAQALQGEVRGIKKSVNFDQILSILTVMKNIMMSHSTQSGREFFIKEVEINPAVISNGNIIALDGVIVFDRISDHPNHCPPPLHKIQSLLEPKSAIIAGASAKNSLNPCSVILSNLIDYGLNKSEIFCLHPKENQIQGVRAFPSIKDIMNTRADPVDLLVIGVPAVSAGQLVNESLDLYPAHSILVISAGFAETTSGKERSDQLQARLTDLLSTPSKRPVLNGPNTVGCIRRSDGNELSTVFVPRWKSSCTSKGLSNMALICQSGGLMISRLSNFADKLNPAYAISVGNQMDLSVTDFLEYLLDKPDATTFALYIEGLNQGDGLRLMKLIKKAKSMGKFVVVYKAGRSQQGQEATQGHTASLAGDYQMFKSLIRTAGGIVVESFSELERVSMLLTCWTRNGGLQKLLAKGKEIVSVGALSNAGFEKCAIADHLFSENLEKIQLCKWNDESKASIEAVFKENRLSEVIDVGDVIDVTPMLNDEATEKVIRAMYLDPELDVCLFSTVPETLALNTLAPSDDHNEDYLDPKALLPRLVGVDQHFGDKLMVMSIESGDRYEPFRRAAFEYGIPCFGYSDEAARAVELVLGSL
ncbi:hypothetical protein P9112_010277 [Eukaryota sp. TZLM1-RC]